MPRAIAYIYCCDGGPDVFQVRVGCLRISIEMRFSRIRELLVLGGRECDPLYYVTVYA